MDDARLFGVPHSWWAQVREGMESLEYLGKLEPPLGSHLFSGGTSAPFTAQAAGNM